MKLNLFSDVVSAWSPVPSFPCLCFVFPGDQHSVFNELSALRRQLRSEQKRLEVRLQQDDWEDMDSPLSDRSEYIQNQNIRR